MQIKLKMVDEDHTIEVPNDADFLTVFTVITKAMRDECIYEDEIQSISFWCLGSKLRLLRVLNGDPS
tara:strand:+ start:57 stop:257 length:201 start_codon:yes stop_codon:yes gene_type:complete